MNKDRKEQITKNLKNIIDSFESAEEKPEISMFELISRYNQEFDNKELIGGKWVSENTDIKLP